MGLDLLRYSSLEFRHLRLVLAVAETRSLTAAANRLKLTPSALSHQLRQLEEVVGAAVFRRDGKVMRPNEIGMLLLRKARGALEILHDIEDQIRGGALLRTQTIRVCSHCYTAYHWLPPVINRFKRTHASVDVQILPDPTRYPFEALHQRDLDLVLSFDPPA